METLFQSNYYTYKYELRNFHCYSHCFEYNNGCRNSCIYINIFLWILVSNCKKNKLEIIDGDLFETV
jgi:hypothetical protein